MQTYKHYNARCTFKIKRFYSCKHLQITFYISRANHRDELTSQTFHACDVKLAKKYITYELLLIHDMFQDIQKASFSNLSFVYIESFGEGNVGDKKDHFVAALKPLDWWMVCLGLVIYDSPNKVRWLIRSITSSSERTEPYEILARIGLKSSLRFLGDLPRNLLPFCPAVTW